MATMNRRQFLKIPPPTLAGSSLALLGFSPEPALAEVRQYKLSRATETRNTCPYCSVGCGILMYGLGDGAKNAKASIIHIEGDPDHPVIAAPCVRKARACSTSSTARAASNIPSTVRRARTSGNGSAGTTHSTASRRR